jgi:hypothetical protein
VIEDLDRDDVDIGALIEAHLEALQDRLHTALPGRVERYDAAKQLADVAPQIKRALSREDGSLVYETHPTIRAVPVVHPRWGSWFVHAPLAAGDTVLLLCCEGDLAQWRQTGQVSAPLDVRRHHLAHAVAIPGLFPRGKELASSSVPSDAMLIGKDAGAVIRIKSNGDIEIGQNAMQLVALANLVKARLDTIQQQFDAHTHQYVPGTLTAVATGPAVPLIGSLGDVAASKVRAE